MTIIVLVKFEIHPRNFKQTILTVVVLSCSTLRTEPIFLAHAENRLCGIPVLFPLSMCCQLPSYNILGSHFNHRLTVVNSIKRAADIKNWFKPVVWTKQNTNTAESIFRVGEEN